MGSVAGTVQQLELVGQFTPLHVIMLRKVAEGLGAQN